VNVEEESKQLKLTLIISCMRFYDLANCNISSLNLANQKVLLSLMLLFNS